MSSVVLNELGSLGRGTRHMDFKHSSILIMISVLALDSRRSVIKFMAMWDQGHYEEGRNMSIFYSFLFV